MKIRGNTVGTTMPRPDWKQTDPRKADYIFNKPDIEGMMGSIEAALDAIIAIQEELIPDETIIFYIYDTEYTANKGMTWGEWCDSEYNTVGFFDADGEIDTGAGLLLTPEGDSVTGSDVIIAGAVYYY